MISASPQIGFDRFIDIQWVEAALTVRAGRATSDELGNLLDESGLSVAAKRKTRTILNRLWLNPRPELQGFVGRGVAIYKANPSVGAAALSWGVAIATYPFFGRVAEIVGRLFALQGDCSSAEVHRRMSEVYGEREGTYRMTNMVLQSQASWGAIQRVENGRRLSRLPRWKMVDDRAMEWLVEAAVRYVGRPIAVETISVAPVLYPLALDRHLAYVLSKSEALELRSEGSGHQSVGLRAA